MSPRRPSPRPGRGGGLALGVSCLRAHIWQSPGDHELESPALPWAAPISCPAPWPPLLLLLGRTKDMLSRGQEAPPITGSTARFLLQAPSPSRDLSTWIGSESERLSRIREWVETDAWSLDRGHVTKTDVPGKKSGSCRACFWHFFRLFFQDCTVRYVCGRRWRRREWVKLRGGF